MAVYKTDGGKYRIQFMLDGKTYVRTSKTVDKKIAERMEAEWKTKIHAKAYLGEREQIMVKQMFDTYIAQARTAATKKNATSFLNVFGKFTKLDVNASDFNQLELERYVEKRTAEGVKASTLRTHMRIFSGVWHRVNKKLYDVPDLVKPKFGKIPVTTVYVTLEEEEQLFAFLRQRDPHGAGCGEWSMEIHDLFLFMFDTGVRYNEVAKLEWSQVDIARRRLEVFRNKTSTESYIHMTDRLHAMFVRRAAKKLHEQWVFPNRQLNNHRLLSTSYLIDVMQFAGLKKTVHHIRHGFATGMLKDGMTLVEVKELLGHSSINSTMRYSHLETSDISSKAVQLRNRRSKVATRPQLRIVK